MDNTRNTRRLWRVEGDGKFGPFILRVRAETHAEAQARGEREGTVRVVVLISE